MTDIEVFVTGVYDAWLRRLRRRDPQAARRIHVRIDRLIRGNPGDSAPIGGGLSELRLHFGPGYRVYYWQKGQRLIIVLCGGEKTTQSSDIYRAHELAKDWKDDGDEVQEV